MGIRRRKWLLILCLLTVVMALTWFPVRMLFAEDSGSITTSIAITTNITTQTPPKSDETLVTTETTASEPSPVVPTDTAEATTIPDNAGAVSTSVDSTQLDQIIDLIQKLENNLLITVILISVCIVINVLTFLYLIWLIGKVEIELREDISTIKRDQHPK